MEIQKKEENWQRPNWVHSAEWEPIKQQELNSMHQSLQNIKNHPVKKPRMKIFSILSNFCDL